MGKDSIGAAMAARIKTIARENKADARILLTRFAQERFLHRFQSGPNKDRFVLKGGMLFMCRDEGSNRPTEDVDLHDMDARDLETITESVIAAAAMDMDDGVVFDRDSLSSVRIREGFRPGTRVVMNASIGPSIVRIKLDICSGDALTPAAVIRNLPSALPKFFDPISIPSYSWETVIAEKIHAMTTFGIDSTRMKDWYDIATIAQEEVIEGAIAVSAITRTFALRRTEIDPDPVALSDAFVSAKSAEFGRWVRNVSAPEGRKTLTVVVETARGFLYPILEAAAEGTEFDATWNPENGWSGAAAPKP
jgi:predicted nucleotidyltransferase component of viral defense system